MTYFDQQNIYFLVFSAVIAVFIFTLISNISRKKIFVRRMMIKKNIALAESLIHVFFDIKKAISNIRKPTISLQEASQIQNIQSNDAHSQQIKASNNLQSAVCFLRIEQNNHCIEALKKQKMTMNVFSLIKQPNPLHKTIAIIEDIQAAAAYLMESRKLSKNEIQQYKNVLASQQDGDPIHKKIDTIEIELQLFVQKMLKKI